MASVISIRNSYPVHSSHQSLNQSDLHNPRHLVLPPPKVAMMDSDASSLQATLPKNSASISHSTSLISELYSKPDCNYAYVSGPHIFQGLHTRYCTTVVKGDYKFGFKKKDVVSLWRGSGRNCVLYGLTVRGGCSCTYIQVVARGLRKTTARCSSSYKSWRPELSHDDDTSRILPHVRTTKQISLGFSKSEQ